MNIEGNDTFMKTTLRFIGLCLALSIVNIQLSSAQTSKNIFDQATPIVYLGIDFTQAKVIGEPTVNETEIRDRHFPGINNAVVNQSNQYDIAGALNRSEVSSDLSQVTARNKNIPVQQIKSDRVADFAHLKSTDIQKLVGAYSFAGKAGIGLLFVVDGMSKPEQAASIYVTLINLSNKQVLLTERLEGKGGGFGFRNYWARSIEDIIKKIGNSKYNEWKKKYAT